MKMDLLERSRSEKGLVQFVLLLLLVLLGVVLKDGSTVLAFSLFNPMTEKRKKRNEK